MPYTIAVSAAGLRVRLPIALLLLSACAERRAPPGDSLAAAGAPPSSGVGLQADNSALLVSSARWQSPPDTLVWADSTTRGDTTFVVRGRAVTSVVVLTDSQSVRIDRADIPSGIPAGLFAVWNGTQLKPNADLFTMTYGSVTPQNIIAQITTARARGMKMVISMTGGGRKNYISRLPVTVEQIRQNPDTVRFPLRLGDSVMQFDVARWRARQDLFNTPAIRAAIAEGVKDGTIIGNNVMDEPFNWGMGPANEANSWGPKGTMNKARVDSLCAYVKAQHPTLPQGVFQDYSIAPDQQYRVCDFVTSQFAHRKASQVTAYRDAALAQFRSEGVVPSFAINVLDGGFQAHGGKRNKGWVCPLKTADGLRDSTGGRGTYDPNCRMTPAQIRENGRTLGQHGCFLTGWRYDSAFVAKPENQQAFRDVIATLAIRPAPVCIRS